jgi:hypothetical protein
MVDFVMCVFQHFLRQTLYESTYMNYLDRRKNSGCQRLAAREEWEIIVQWV